MSDTNLPDSPLNGSSLAFAETLYLAYLENPASVPPQWRTYFDRMEDSGLAGRTSLGPSFTPASLFNPPRATNGSGRHESAEAVSSAADLQHRVNTLVRNYRLRGHRVADIDPLGREAIEIPELDPAYHGITAADMSRPVAKQTLPGVATVSELLDALKATYTRSIGAQFMHIDNLEVRRWVSDRMEQSRNRIALSRDTQLRILTKLTDAVIFEEFIQKKFVGAKRFSLEGGESLIPLLDLAIEKAGDPGHRGDRARHGPPRPAQRARQHHGQEPAQHLPRVRRPRPRAALRPRRRQVPPRLQRRLADDRRAQRCTCRSRSTRATSSSSTRWCSGRVRAKQDRLGDLDRNEGLRAPDPRRRRLHRRGRRPGDAEPVASSRATRSAARCT